MLALVYASFSFLRGRRPSLQPEAYYIQVRVFQAFIRIVGLVKGTQLCTTPTQPQLQGLWVDCQVDCLRLWVFTHEQPGERRSSFIADSWGYSGAVCVVPLSFFYSRSNNVKCILRVWFTSYQRKSFIWMIKLDCTQQRAHNCTERGRIADSVASMNDSLFVICSHFVEFFNHVLKQPWGGSSVSVFQTESLRVNEPAICGFSPFVFRAVCFLFLGSLCVKAAVCSLMEGSSALWCLCPCGSESSLEESTPKRLRKSRSSQSSSVARLTNTFRAELNPAAGKSHATEADAVSR